MKTFTTLNALTLFRDGLDTCEIAFELSTNEAKIVKEIHRLRNQERLRARKSAYYQRKRQEIAAYRSMKNLDDRAELREIRAIHS